MAVYNILLESKSEPTIKSAKCSEAVTPGHLIQFDGASKIKKHATAGGNARKAFAMANVNPGKDFDDAYADGDLVPYVIAQRGDVVNALVAAAATAITKGDALESDGAGGLRKHTPKAVDEGGSATFTNYLDAIVGYAAESVDNSGGASAVRIKVEIA